MQRRAFLTSSLVAATAVFPDFVRAQAWPSRPIKMILSSAAGSGVDRAGRLLADRLTKGLAQPVVVENKAGGQNVIGAQAAARSLPDGYTIYLATAAALVSNTFLIKDLPYDPLKDFTPVGFVGFSPFALFVNADSSVKSIQEFIARAKGAPGEVSIANEGPKTFGGITARLFNENAGIKTNLVSYPSAANGVQDVLGGHADSILCDVATASQLTRQGKLRMLAVTTANRLADWNVPALSELLPGFDMVGWFGFVVPAGTPADIVGRLNAELDAALRDPAVKEGMVLVGFQTRGAGTSDEMATFVKIQHERWTRISKVVGLLPE